MIIEEPIKLSDVKALVTQVEKLKSARTPQQYEPISGALQKIRELMAQFDSLSYDIKLYLPDLIQIAVNFLVNHKQYPNTFIQDFEDFMKAVLQLVLNHENLKLSDTFRIIFDPVRMAYEYNLLLTDTNEYVHNPRFPIKEGDDIDCLKTDRGTSRMCWSRARVLYTNGTDFNVRFYNDSITQFVKAQEIRPFKTRSLDYDELLNLNIDQNLLAAFADKWVKSTILNMRSSNDGPEQILEYLIGFRYYDQDGDKIEDLTEMRYFGFNRGYDEWINATSPRLALLKSMHPQRPVNSEYQYIDDSQDYLYIQDHINRPMYGILRPKQSKSVILCNLINYFGEIGGFNFILNRIKYIENPEQWIPVDIMANYLQGIGNIHAQLYRYFAYDYIPQITNSIKINLLNAPDQIIRNMGKEKMFHIVQACQSLLDRIVNEKERKIWLQELSLDFVIVCFKCDFLDKKIMGLKLLSDQLKQSYTDKDQRYQQYMLNWIEKNFIFETLFDPKTHLQLMVRSNELLSIYLNIENALQPRYMDLIWNLMIIEDIELRPIIFKLITTIASSMGSVHIEYFQEKLASLPTKNLQIEHINLIFEMNKYQIKNQGLIYNAINILWQVVEYQSQFYDFERQLNDKFNKAKELEDKARTNLCDLLKNYENTEKKYELAKYLIQNIKNRKVESSSLKTLSYLISLCNTQEYMIQIAKEDVINIILQNLVQFREYIKQLENQQPWQTELQAGYMNSIQERVLLIKSILRNSNITIDYGFLNIIWKEMIMSPLIKQESDLSSNWLKEIVEKQSEDFNNVIDTFFDNTFINFSYAEQISENAFECFKTLLYSVNKRQKKLLRHDEKPGLVHTYNSKGKITSISNVSSGDEVVEKDFQILVNPNEIKGIQFLWNIIYLNKQNVQEKAAILYVKLHLLVSDDLIDQKNQFVAQLIEKVIKQMREQLANNKSEILRSILLLRILLNESETKGIGSLKSLGGLARGELITLSIQNDLTQEPKKAQIKVFCNTTIMELRVKIAKLIKTSWDNIKLARANIFNQSRDIPDTDNGKTVLQVGIKKSENLIITKNPQQLIPQVQLIDQDDNLHPKFRQIISDWFDQYSTDGRMNPDQAAKFTSKAVGGDACSSKDTRIAELFANHDKDKDGLLEKEEFIEFYQQSSKNFLSAVWKNIHSFNYRNDLKSIDQEVELNEQELPRAILANHDSFFNLMFELLREDYDIAQECWKFLNILPASSKAQNTILQLTNNWDEVFPQDQPYHLLYNLKLVEYYLGSQSETVIENEQQIEIEDKMQIEYEWRNNFIIQGGFQQLLLVLQNVCSKPINQITKQIVTFILLVFKLYLAASIQAYQVQSYIKLPLKVTLEQIHRILNDDKDQELVQYKNRGKEPEDFIQLVNELKKNDVGNKLLQNTDLKQLIQQLIDFSHQILSKEDYDYEEKYLIELNIIVITTILVSGQQNVDTVIQTQYREKYVLLLQKQLFLPKYQLIRKACCNALYLLFKFQQNLGSFLIDVLLQIFPEYENKETAQYFEVLCKIIEENKQVDQLKYENLAKQIKFNIRQKDCTETRKNPHHDKTFTGYLQLLESIGKVINVLDEEFALYIFKICLFAFNIDIPLPELNKSQLQEYDPKEYVKCKSQDSRKSAYRLIIQYCQQDNQFLLKNGIQYIFQLIPFYNIFQYKPTAEVKHFSGYVGIRNLGNICYMNAMLQQFFMTQEFRYGFLRVDDGKQIDVQLHKDKDKEIRLDDNLVHQFQRLLAYLELSDRRDFAPYQFCYSYKDYEGKPINIGLQQDTQEFINHFIELLEKGLQDKGWDQILKGIYGGQQCEQIICQGCNNVKEIFQMFYTLTVKVKGLKNLYESFENMISGETIQDYYCDSCQKKNNIVKRQCISQAPNILIVHLQRIYFNLDLLMNEKLSSKLEFPNTFNIYPYTREGLNGIQQVQDYNYKLKGVIIQKGTAQCGHYYSIINVENKWLKFNDSTIEDFDVKKLPSEAYGGNSDQQEFYNIEQPSTNAYILVYEKLGKQSVQLKFKDSQQQQEILNKFNTISNNELVTQLEYNQFDKYIPQDLYHEIWWDNHKFMFEKHIYCEDFFRFIKEYAEIQKMPVNFQQYPLGSDLNLQLPYHGIYSLYSEISIEDQLKYYSILQYLLSLVIDIIPTSADCNIIKEYVNIIRNLLNLIPIKAFELFKYFIISKQERIFQILISAPDQIIRSSIAQIILHMINVITYIHNLSLDINLLQILQTDESSILCDQTMIKFMIDLIQRLTLDVPKNHTRFSQYFEFIRDFVKSGQQQLQFAISVQLVSILADFFMEKGSPLWSCFDINPIEFNFGDKKNVTGKMVQSNYTALFDTIAYLVQNQQQFSKNELQCLNYQYFYSKALTEIVDFNNLTKIILRLSWGNEELTKIICDVLLTAITKANYEQVKPLLNIAYQFVNQQDDLSDVRIEWIFGYPQPYFNKKSEGLLQNIQQISDQFVQFPPSFNSDCQTILENLFVNRKRFESYCLLLLQFLLQSANNNQRVFIYIVNTPPPSYVYAKYVDWFFDFLELYKREIDTQSLFFDKQKEYKDTMQEYEKFCQTYIQFYQIPLPIQQQTQELQGLLPNYIIGTCVKQDTIQEINIGQDITLICIEQQHFITKSRPQAYPYTNLVFPQSILYEHQFIQTNKIDPQSNIFNLIGAKFSNIPKPPPLPIKTDKDKVDGIDFSTDVKVQEQSVVNEAFLEQFSQYSMELENIGQTTSNVIALPMQTYESIQVDLFVSNFIRRYMVDNQTDKTINFTFQITSEPESFLNFRPPQKIYAILQPKSQTYIVSLVKTFHNLEWGQYCESTNVMYGEVQLNKEVSQDQNKIKNSRVDEEVQVYGPSLPDADGQIQCPTCTLLQSKNNAFCQLCGGSFS